jgi:amino-acid N-acetyltransferase
MMLPEPIESAGPGDEAALRAFLQSAGLPAADVDPRRQEYLLAHEGGALVGTIGLEIHGQDGLLRSLAVAPHQRGRGLAAKLHDGALELARSRGLRTVYLLTTTAESYATRRGFERIPRSEVPPGILALPQFRGLCPGTAVCMRLRLASVSAPA